MSRSWYAVVQFSDGKFIVSCSDIKFFETFNYPSPEAVDLSEIWEVKWQESFHSDTVDGDGYFSASILLVAATIQELRVLINKKKIRNIRNLLQHSGGAEEVHPEVHPQRGKRSSSDKPNNADQEREVMKKRMSKTAIRVSQLSASKSSLQPSAHRSSVPPLKSLGRSELTSPIKECPITSTSTSPLARALFKKGSERAKILTSLARSANSKQESSSNFLVEDFNSKNGEGVEDTLKDKKIGCSMDTKERKKDRGVHENKTLPLKNSKNGEGVEDTLKDKKIGCSMDTKERKKDRGVHENKTLPLKSEEIGMDDDSSKENMEISSDIVRRGKLGEMDVMKEKAPSESGEGHSNNCFDTTEVDKNSSPVSGKKCDPPSKIVNSWREKILSDDEYSDSTEDDATVLLENTKKKNRECEKRIDQLEKKMQEKRQEIDDLKKTVSELKGAIFLHKEKAKDMKKELEDCMKLNLSLQKQVFLHGQRDSGRSTGSAEKATHKPRSSSLHGNENQSASNRATATLASKSTLPNSHSLKNNSSPSAQHHLGSKGGQAPEVSSCKDRRKSSGTSPFLKRVAVSPLGSSPDSCSPSPRKKVKFSRRLFEDEKGSATSPKKVSSLETVDSSEDEHLDESHRNPGSPGSSAEKDDDHTSDEETIINRICDDLKGKKRLRVIGEKGSEKVYVGSGIYIGKDLWEDKLRKIGKETLFLKDCAQGIYGISGLKERTGSRKTATLNPATPRKMNLLTAMVLGKMTAAGESEVAKQMVRRKTVSWFGDKCYDVRREPKPAKNSKKEEKKEND